MGAPVHAFRVDGGRVSITPIDTVSADVSLSLKSSRMGSLDLWFGIGLRLVDDLLRKERLDLSVRETSIFARMSFVSWPMEALPSILCGSQRHLWHDAINTDGNTRLVVKDRNYHFPEIIVLVGVLVLGAKDSRASNLGLIEFCFDFKAGTGCAILPKPPVKFLAFLEFNAAASFEHSL